MSTLVLKLSPESCLRGVIDSNGSNVFSVYDFISYAYEKCDNGVFARKTFARLVSLARDSEHRAEVLGFCTSLKLPSPGQRKIPVTNIRGLQRLLMLLGGRITGQFRKSAEEVFTKVLAGDRSLIEAINVNAASQQPIAQMARAALDESAPLYATACQNPSGCGPWLLW